jgi:endoglucanase
MAAAHMDEVALMITGIEGDGTLRFRPVGGIDDRVLLGKVVRVGSERIPGVIGVKPVHLLKVNERTAVIKIDAQRIDIGAENKDAAARLVKLGDYAVFATQYGPLAPACRRAAGALPPVAAPPVAPARQGQGLDDRAVHRARRGPARQAPALRPARRLHRARRDRLARRARGGARHRPGTPPSCSRARPPMTCRRTGPQPEHRAGRGPALTVMDRSLLADHALLEHVQNSAKALRIPTQFKQPATGGTDGGAIHLARAGVPTAVISVPCRYIHSPVAVLDVTDLENTIKLTRAALERLTPAVLARKS